VSFKKVEGAKVDYVGLLIPSFASSSFSCFAYLFRFPYHVRFIPSMLFESKLTIKSRKHSTTSSTSILPFSSSSPKKQGVKARRGPFPIFPSKLFLFLRPLLHREEMSFTGTFRLNSKFLLPFPSSLYLASWGEQQQQPTKRNKIENLQLARKNFGFGFCAQIPWTKGAEGQGASFRTFQAKDHQTPGTQKGP